VKGAMTLTRMTSSQAASPSHPLRCCSLWRGPHGVQGRRPGEDDSVRHPRGGVLTRPPRLPRSPSQVLGDHPAGGSDIVVQGELVGVWPQPDLVDLT
jgi:hypothetical protein